MSTTTQITTQQIKQEIANRKSELEKANRGENDGRLGVGVAMEITVRLLAPELFERVLAVVQGRAT